MPPGPGTPTRKHQVSVHLQTPSSKTLEQSAPLLERKHLQTSFCEGRSKTNLFHTASWEFTTIPYQCQYRTRNCHFLSFSCHRIEHVLSACNFCGTLEVYIIITIVKEEEEDSEQEDDEHSQTCSKALTEIVTRTHTEEHFQNTNHPRSHVW